MVDARYFMLVEFNIWCSLDLEGISQTRWKSQSSLSVLFWKKEETTLQIREEC